MSYLSATDSVFAGTTVDPTAANRYLFNTEFKMLRYAQANSFHPLAVAALDRMEFIGLQVRHYVAGHAKTLHRTLKEVRRFVADYPDFAQGLVPAMIDILRAAFLKNQWFELMGKLDYASKKITHLMKRFLTQ